MKKILAMSAMCASIAALTSCSGDNKTEAAAPVADPTVTSDTIAFVSNGSPSGKDIRNYNAAGQVASVDSYSAADAKTGTAVYKDGKVVYEVTFNEKNVEDGNVVYTYDEAGRIVETTTSAFNQERQKVEPATQIKYAYNEAGDVTAVKEYSYVNLRWVKVYEWDYAYDEQGRFVDRKDFTGDGKEAKQSCWYTYTYSDGNKIQQEDFYYFDLKTGKLKHDAKFVYTYNAADQVLTRTMIRHKNNQKRDDINSRLFTYTYNNAGQLTNLQEQRWNSGTNTWYDVKNTAWEYDEQGRQILFSQVANTNKGVKMNQEYISYAADSKAVAAPAAVAANGKPVVNLEEKHLTEKEDE